MSKDFAKKYWREFEKLLFLIIDNNTKELPEKHSVLTQKRKDGGYDVIISFKAFSSQYDYLKILGEAKLRKFSNNDLKLSEFSKTFIVATNTLSSYVVIASNLYYTNMTKQQLEIFKSRTGIKYELLDYPKIRYWIENNPKSVTQLDKKFIKELTSYPINQKEIQPYSLFENDFYSINNEKLIGDKRKKLFSEILMEMQIHLCEPFHIIIQAYQGVGKTCFINNLVSHFKSLNIIYYKIDLSQFSISRDLFIEFLSIIWCVDKEIILSEATDILEGMFNNMVFDYIDKQTMDALKMILSLEESKFSNDPDLWDMLLLEYLKIVFIPIINRINPIIIFENLDISNSKVYNFAIKVFNYFSSLNLHFIIEHRTNIHQNNFDLEMNSNIHIIDLPELSKLDCSILLKNKYQEMPDNIDIIINICSNNPLYLLNLYPILSEIKDLKFLEKVNEYNLLYNTKLATQYIEQSMKQQFLEIDVEIKQLILLISLLKGKISFNNLKLFVDNNADVQNIIETLLKTGYFAIENNNIRLKHVIYLKYINKYDSYLTPYEVYEIMNKIMNYESRLELDVLSKKLLLFDIYIYTKHEKLLIMTKAIVNDLFLLSEFSQCLERLIKSYEVIYYTINIEEKLWINNRILYCYIMINDYQNDQLPLYIDEQNKFFKYNKDKFYEEYFYFVYICCKISLATGEYNNILDLADTIHYDVSINEEIIERIIQLKFLAIKHLQTLNEAMEFLKAELDKYPNSIVLNYSYLTHESNIMAGDTKESLKYLNKIKLMYSKLTLEEQQHNENNIAVCYFYLQDYNKSTEMVESIQTLCYLNNFKDEESRAYHTNAMIDLANNLIDDSITKFNKALNILQTRSSHATHIWPIYVNLSSLYLIKGDIIYFEQMTTLGFKHLHLKYLNNLMHIKKQSIEKQPKYYIGLLILINNVWGMYHNKEMIKSIFNYFDLSCLQNDFNKYIKGDKLKSILECTKYNINNYLILKV